MEIDYFQLNRAEYFVPIIVKIPGRELALAKRFGAEHTVIDFVCEIKDEATGFTATHLRDYVDIKLTDATASELAQRPSNTTPVLRCFRADTPLSFSRATTKPEGSEPTRRVHDPESK